VQCDATEQKPTIMGRQRFPLNITFLLKTCAESRYYKIPTGIQAYWGWTATIAVALTAVVEICIKDPVATHGETEAIKGGVTRAALQTPSPAHGASDYRSSP